MSLLLFFTGHKRGGHFYQEHPARARMREREKQQAEYAAKQLEEGRKKRAAEAAQRELDRLRELIQATLAHRIAIDSGREAVANAAHDLSTRQEQDEEEAIILLLLN